MRSPWVDYYTEESVEEVTRAFEKEGFVVELNLEKGEQAIGFIEGESRFMVLNPKFYRPGTGRQTGSCIEISSKSKDFQRVREVINKILHIN